MQSSNRRVFSGKLLSLPASLKGLTTFELTGQADRDSFSVDLVWGMYFLQELSSQLRRVGGITASTDHNSGRNAQTEISFTDGENEVHLEKGGNTFFIKIICNRRNVAEILVHLSEVYSALFGMLIRSNEYIDLVRNGEQNISLDHEQTFNCGVNIPGIDHGYKAVDAIGSIFPFIRRTDKNERERHEVKPISFAQMSILPPLTIVKGIYRITIVTRPTGSDHIDITVKAEKP